MNMNITNGILAGIFIITLIAVSPLVTIASINCLFNTAIAYDFYTWAASLWVMSLLGAFRFSMK